MTMNVRFLIVALVFTACSPVKPDPSVLIETDLAFSALSSEKGMAEAFLAYADSAVVKLQDQQFPAWGIEELKNSFQDVDDSKFVLTWEPLKAEIAASGDLGYTMGNWTLVTTGGNTRYGNYVSVWKKQADGKWKFVLDAGTSTPGIFKPE